MRPGGSRRVASVLTAAAAFSVVITVFAPAIAQGALPLFGKRTAKSTDVPGSTVPTLSDLSSRTLSAEAVELAKQLGLTRSLVRLSDLRRQLDAPNRDKIQADLSEDLRDAKEELREAIEQARLDIDVVQAEICEDQSIYSKLLWSYSSDRQAIINKTNLWSFRTNGALWTVTEGLAIPTFKRPRYSVSSGIVGIFAGLVPSAFSLGALHAPFGRHYCRVPRSNMLAKVLGCQTDVRTDFPASVWSYLNAPVPGDASGKSRVERLIERWLADKHLRLFTDRSSAEQLNLLTGSVEHNLTVELLADRMTMLDELSALTQKLNRPLCELMMFVRNNKELPAHALD